jgi:DNA excision repair protein ERCC-2
MEDIDLVVCNYHHLLDPMIREQFFRWLDCDPSDVITVFDEAHNIEGAARDHATKTMTETTLDAALDELAGLDDSRAEPARNVIEAFRDALIVTYEDELNEYERDNVGDHWEDVSVANPDARDEITLAFLRLYEGRGIDTETELAAQLGRTLDEEYERAYKDGEATSRAECQTLQAAQFISTWMDEGGELGQHPMAGVRRNDQTGDVYGRVELYTCIPREVTRDLFDDVYASVLMSATLRPFDVTEDVLGLDSPATMAYGLAYPEANRRTYAAEVPALFASERDDPETQETISQLLGDVIRFTPGNTLLFFPSYSEAERYHSRLSVENRADEPFGTLILDESGKSTEDLRQRFVASDDAVLFTSLWGTLAEGVSFDGNEARTVAVIGVPYPKLSERMEAVQDAYERAYSGTHQKRDAGWAYAVEIPTIRKTRQALGRVIRSPEDFGVRILADKRYTNADMGKYSVRRSFPVEEREELVDISPEKLKFAMLNFYTDHDAYDGTPPEP